jgi:hypothetical protein
MASVDPSQVPALVASNGVPVMMESYEAVPQVAPRICEVITTDGSIYGDKESVLTGLGRPDETPDGARVKSDTFQDAYTWQIRIPKWTKSVRLPRRLLNAADGQQQAIRVIERAGRAWGQSYAYEKETRVAAVFENGTLAAGHLATFDGSFPNNADPYPKFIYDGKPFFAASGNGHVLAGSDATPFNLIASAALSSTTLQTALTAIRDTNAIDERGQKILIVPDVIVVPTGLEYSARQLLSSVNLPGSANNDVNPIAGMLEPIVWRFLSTAAAWYVGQSRMGVRVYDSGAPVLESYYDADTQEVVVSATMYHGVGVTNWRYWFANNKATS